MACQECSADERSIMPQVRWDELEAQFKTEVTDPVQSFNSGEEDNWTMEQDFCSLTIGWAVAKGLSLDHAYTFALHIRYHTNLG